MCLGLDGGAYHFGADPVGVLSAFSDFILKVVGNCRNVTNSSSALLSPHLGFSAKLN